VLITIVPSYEEPVCLESAHLQLSGGILADSLWHSVIATFTDDGWVHRGKTCKEIAIDGMARLLLGLPRSPWAVSTPMSAWVLKGTALLAGGQTIATYTETRDMWRTAAQTLWWHSAHMVAAESFVEDFASPLDVDALHPAEGMRERQFIFCLPPSSSWVHRILPRT
jgi:hypothetical protein